MSNALKVLSPHDQHVIEEIPMVGAKEVEAALAKAHANFTDRSKWLPKHERVAILERTAALMESQVEVLTKMAAEEGGKPYKDSKVEVLRAINGVKLAMEDLSYLGGEEIPMGHTPTSVNRWASTRREPIGVVSSISAFNHPLNLIVHQTVPAIAVGAPVVVKPALTTPRSCIKFVQLLHEAGLPAGWCESLICENEHAQQLVTDSRVNFFSFIGSAKVGWYLRSQLSPGTRCALEHGGAAPVIIGPDANLDEVVPPLVKGGYYHSGQVCVSVQRVYCHEKIKAELIEKIALALDKLTVGDPLQPETDCGPLILHRETTRIAEWVEEARQAGAQVVRGGQMLSEAYYAPTLLVDPPADAKVSTAEIFGPVVCVYGYTHLDDAIDRANSLPYAFQGSVFTQRLDDALKVADRMNATAVMVNDHTAFRVDWMPFGGRDESGLGLGGIKYSMLDMSREKLIVFKSKVL